MFCNFHLWEQKTFLPCALNYLNSYRIHLEWLSTVIKKYLLHKQLNVLYVASLSVVIWTLLGWNEAYLGTCCDCWQTWNHSYFLHLQSLITTQCWWTCNIFFYQNSRTQKFVCMTYLIFLWCHTHSFPFTNHIEEKPLRGRLQKKEPWTIEHGC